MDYQKLILKCSPVGFKCSAYILVPLSTSELSFIHHSVRLKDILLTFAIWLLDSAVKRIFSWWRENQIACVRVTVGVITMFLSVAIKI